MVSSYCGKVEGKCLLLYSETFFMLCIFNEIQACEEESISVDVSKFLITVKNLMKYIICLLYNVV